MTKQRNLRQATTLSSIYYLVQELVVNRLLISKTTGPITNLMATLCCPPSLFPFQPSSTSKKVIQLLSLLCIEASRQDHLDKTSLMPKHCTEILNIRIIILLEQYEQCELHCHQQRPLSGLQRRYRCNSLYMLCNNKQSQRNHKSGHYLYTSLLAPLR